MLTRPLSEYDHIASEYYSERHVTSRNFDQATMGSLRNHNFPFPSSGLVLDLGSGRGSAGRYLRLDPSRVIQVDLSHRMLTLADRETSLGRVLCDASNLPFVDDCFDGVCAFLFDPYLRSDLFMAIARVLKPGGAFLGTLPSKTWGDAIRGVRKYSTDVARFLTVEGEYVQCRSSLVSALRLPHHMAQAGFSNVKIEELSLPENMTPVSPDITDAARHIGTEIHDLPIINAISARI